MSTEEFYSHELIDWEKAICFYFEEMAIFKERLSEVINKNTRPEILSVTEHFQNTFIAQQEVLRVLKNDIGRQEERLAGDVKNGCALRDIDTVDIQFLLRERMHTAENLFLENKHSFYRFLAKVF